MLLLLDSDYRTDGPHPAAVGWLHPTLCARRYRNGRANRPLCRAEQPPRLNTFLMLNARCRSKEQRSSLCLDLRRLLCEEKERSDNAIADVLAQSCL